MDHRQLGRSGLRVSTIALGTAAFGTTGGLAAWGGTDLDGARRQIDMCLDAGVNLVDTADAYADGASEDLVGRALQGRRDDVLISTKVRFPVGSGVNDSGLSRHHVLRAVEASLRRLRTRPHRPVHRPRVGRPGSLDETMRALDDLVRAGKVRYLAVSNYAAWQIMKALAVSDAHGWERFSATQVYYSLESRDAEYEIVPLSVDQGLGVVVWSPLAGGLLTGKYRRDRSPEVGRYLDGWTEPPVRDTEKLYSTVDVLVDVAARRGVEPAQAALAWLLTRPAVSSLIVGARTPGQLATSLAAGDVRLDDEDLAALDRVSWPDLIYPHWHQDAIPAEFRGPSDVVLHPG